MHTKKKKEEKHKTMETELTHKTAFRKFAPCHEDVH